MLAKNNLHVALFDYIENDRSHGFGTGQIGSAAKRAVEPLLTTLEHADATVRANSAVALLQIEKHPKGAAALKEMLASGEDPAPYQAAVAIGRLGDGAEPFIGNFDDLTGFHFSNEFRELQHLSIVDMMDRFNDIAQNQQIDPAEVDDITMIGFEVTDDNAEDIEPAPAQDEPATD